MIKCPIWIGFYFPFYVAILLGPGAGMEYLKLEQIMGKTKIGFKTNPT